MGGVCAGSHKTFACRVFSTPRLCAFSFRALISYQIYKIHSTFFCSIVPTVEFQSPVLCRNRVLRGRRSFVPVRAERGSRCEDISCAAGECVAGTVIIASEWSCRSSPDGAQEESGNGEGLADGADRGLDGDPEGVWSPDIEQSFQEALAIYPPCGRRKIILSDEGKMYGRNELIARYIKLRTGKTRTRKQVSSHIQVLARKRVREYQASIKDQVSKDKALQTVANLSSAQIVSASVMKPQTPFPPPVRYWPGPVPGQPGHSQDIKPFAQPPYTTLPAPVPPPISYETLPPPRPTAIAAPVWQDRTIASAKLRLLEYSAFMESQKDRETYKHLFVHIGPSNPGYSDPVLESIDVRQIYDKFSEKKGGLKELYEKGPHNAFFLVKFWADLSGDIEEGPSAFYGVSSQYSGTEGISISVSTKVCSFGKQVVEKVETEFGLLEGGKYMFRIHRSPMCEYMINFIHKLKHLPEKYMMNSVLENFTILQVVSNRETQETLLCIAFVFEVSTSEHGAQYHVYRLVND
ncbi:transcriptional enhancer factor TEF-5 isoform X2 [Xiphophorus couchianus]|uniref:transcriptional enhancer factor TEF-5 isoform X2 n=1 Tax=Xiphophorus couchianus TaxID=32473 RepID=UPI001015DCC1|nr:transcriptional enhancer factor TEF-5-like isoform X2 [Xiphophorus couchianus]